MKATKIFTIERVVELESGVLCRLHMDLFDVGQERGSQSLFLGRFRFSWIFFEIENPMRRVLMDCHEPYGVHVHFDNGPQEPINAEILDEVRDFFAIAIKSHFGVEIEV